MIKRRSWVTGGAFEIGPMTTNTWLCRYQIGDRVWSRDHGPAALAMSPTRRGVLGVGIKTEFRRGEAEAGVDHR